MLLAICKNNLVVCARGHASVSCSRIGATRWDGVWGARAPASWRQTRTPAECVGDLRWLHTLNHRICSVVRCSSTPSPVPEITGHVNAPCRTECVTGSPHWRGHWRTFISGAPFSGNVSSSSSAGPGVKFQPWVSEAPHNFFGVRLSPLCPGALPGGRGLCTGPPREPPLVEEKLKDTGTPRAGTPSPVPGHGLFKFKELFQYENPWTIPNLLCVCRMLLAPVLGYLIIEQHFHLSLGLFALAGATDLLDGYIARTWPNQKSNLGSALDPLADKILISFLYVSLTYAQLIPAPLTLLVISRDVGLIAAVFYVRYKTVPPPVTLSKFFNPCYATAQLTPTFFSKVNTAIQLFLVAASLASPVFHFTDSLWLQSLWYITAITTTASGYSYYHYGMKTVEALNSAK